MTSRMTSDIRGLRRRDVCRVVAGAILSHAERDGFRIIEFSVMDNHIHLICEAASRTALARGVMALKTSIAMRLNKLWERHGKMFAERYHDHVLKMPTEVRNALAYVLNNARKHAAEQGRRMARGWIDPCSSARWFFGVEKRALGLPRPETWLLQTGWRQAGPIQIDQVPGGLRLAGS